MTSVWAATWPSRFFRRASPKGIDEQEARAASALNHPNIVTIYEIADEDGMCFIVMEYIAGRTLDQVLTRGPMRLREMLDIAVPIADALARAHSAGIVHRDLKPGNIIVGDDGQVKLLDFGLAKLTEVATPEPSHATQTMAALTEEGQILGTVAYMSPEQTEGRKVDARSDIFSLGSVLYEMATGRRPFISTSRVSTMAAIIHEDPKPVRETVPNLPPDLERIIARCMRKDLGRRFQSAADLRISLQDVIRDSESGIAISVAPGTQPSRQPSPERFLQPSILRFAGGALLLCALTAGATWAWFARSSASTDVPFEILPLTASRGQEIQPAISPDGKQVAFAWDGDPGTNFDLYVRLVSGGPALRLTNTPRSETFPTWSPDGSRIAFLRDGAIYSVAALGGAERKIAAPSPSPAASLVWTVDGKYLLYSAGSPRRIWGMPVEGGEPHPLTKGSADGRSVAETAVAVAPDGHSLAIVGETSYYSHAVLLAELAPGALELTGEPHAITPYDSSVIDLAWTSDSSAIVTARRLVEGGTGLWRLERSGKLRPLGIPVGVREPAISRTGNLLVYRRREVRAELIRIDGPDSDRTVTYDQVHPQSVVGSSGIDSLPMISPDGRQLLFVSTRTGWSELHLAGIDGSDQNALTDMKVSLGSPRWSPDGTRIVFDAFENARSVIYTTGTGGGRPVRLTEDGTSSAVWPSWSRDGKWIYSTISRGQETGIWKSPSTGGESQRITSGDMAFESEDGKNLYYGKERSVWRMPVSGGESTRLVTAATDYWNTAGNNIYFFTVERPHTLMVYRSATGKTFPYLVLPASMTLYPGGVELSVSKDERTIVFNLQTRMEGDIMKVENFR